MTPITVYCDPLHGTSLLTKLILTTDRGETAISSRASGILQWRYLMRATRRVAVVAIFCGSLLVVSVARAGEVKGKVSAAGLKSAENIAVYLDAIPGRKIRSSIGTSNS